MNQDTLASLSEDGHLTNLPSVQPEGDNTTESSPTNDDVTTQEKHLITPTAATVATEMETIHQAVQSLGERSTTTSSTLMWPSIEGTPINEFYTEGNFSMAFPTLFPKGKCLDIGNVPPHPF